MNSNLFILSSGLEMVTDDANSRFESPEASYIEFCLFSLTLVEMPKPID